MQTDGDVGWTRAGRPGPSAQGMPMTGMASGDEYAVPAICMQKKCRCRSQIGTGHRRIPAQGAGQPFFHYKG